MSTVLEDRPLARAPRKGWLPWAALLPGLGLLYLPTYLDLSRGLWREDAYAHGPIIVALFAWLVWRARAVLVDAALRPAPVAGLACLAFGLALYLLGRTQSLAVFEVASHIPVLAGCVLLLRGWGGARSLAFPLLFLFFLIPLPGFVLDFVTVPLKEMVSAAVEWLLLAAGYPVERSGVVLAVGGHEMLVADACSGLASLTSLLALGLLYLHLTRTGPQWRRVALVLAAIVPIALVANVLRVLALVLVTHHLGEEAARGLLHDFAGMLVFVAAFLMLVGFDTLVRGKKPVPDASFARRKPVSDTSFSLAAVAAVAMIGTAAAAPALKPVHAAQPIDLERAIPAAFGDWRIDPEMVPLTPAPDVQANLARLYDQIVSRTYVNAQGERMMLTVAYGGDQSDALKAHRQEACYAAQGFEIRGIAHGTLSTAGRTIPVTRMLAVRGERSEPVTYWFTMGDRVVLGRFERLRTQLENGLAGRIPDGMLVRVSSLSHDPARALAAQEAFVAAIAAAIPATERARLLGAARS